MQGPGELLICIRLWVMRPFPFRISGTDVCWVLVDSLLVGRMLELLIDKADFLAQETR
jgi:hypothetical protein